MDDNIKAQVSDLLGKEMDRLTFLKHVGIGFVAITGVSTLVKTMGSFGGTKSQAAGYGASTYGGSVTQR